MSDGQVGFELIQFVKLFVFIATIINFDGHGNGNGICKQTLMVTCLPLDRQNNRHTRMKTLPSRNTVGEQ